MSIHLNFQALALQGAGGVFPQLSTAVETGLANGEGVYAINFKASELPADLFQIQADSSDISDSNNGNSIKFKHGTWPTDDSTQYTDSTSSDSGLGGNFDDGDSFTATASNTTAKDTLANDFTSLVCKHLTGSRDNLDLFDNEKEIHDDVETMMNTIGVNLVTRFNTDIRGTVGSETEYNKGSTVDLSSAANYPSQITQDANGNNILSSSIPVPANVVFDAIAGEQTRLDTLENDLSGRGDVTTFVNMPLAAGDTITFNVQLAIPADASGYDSGNQYPSPGSNGTNMTAGDTYRVKLTLV